MARSVLDRTWFRVAFAVYAAGLVLWLTVGLLPVLVDKVPAVDGVVSDLAARGGFFAGPATLLLHPTMTITGVSGNALLQYGFSLLNLVLGVLLIVRRPDDLVPRLLALGLLGTAATFNLPSHEAFHLLGSPWPIALVHFTFHIVSGVAYLWAVVLFPDGRLPARIDVSARALTVAAVAVTGGTALICWWSDFLAHPQFFVIFFGIAIPVAGVGSQLIRISDATTTGPVRRSARLLMAALLPALTVALIWCVATIVALTGGGTGDFAAGAAERLQDLFPAVFAIVPVVLFAGVLRYRLFDIDRILSRVLVYGLLIVGSGAVYLAAVITGASLVGGADWWTVLVLAAAAVALQPAWSSAERWANRVVFGTDLGPAAAMKALITGLEQATPTTELDQVLDVSVRTTRAVRAELWQLDGLRWSLRAAVGSASTGGISAESVTDSAAPSLVAGRHWPVTYKGEQLGVLVIWLSGHETLPAAQRTLLADLAAHAGLLLHNTMLAGQLAAHIDALTERAAELSASRRRLVAAQDRERRRVERDLHDGAQQTLVAVMLGLRMAGAQPDTADGRRSRGALLRQLARELETSRAELEEISSGQGPAVLRRGDLLGALEQSAATARRSGLAVELTVELSVDAPRSSPPLTRAEPSGAQVSGANAADSESPDVQVDPEVVAAVYFCCSEALQNVVKYAHASSARIEVRTVGTDIVFAVTDDGTGLANAGAMDGAGGLTGLQDRVALLRGWIAVDSAPGGGTRIRGAVPRLPAPDSSGSPLLASDEVDLSPVGAQASGAVGGGQA